MAKPGQLAADLRPGDRWVSGAGRSEGSIHELINDQNSLLCLPITHTYSEIETQGKQICPHKKT